MFVPNPEKYGHTFIGWEDINTHKIMDNSFIYNYESSISLKAVYKPNNYIIYVDTDNDGEYDNSYDVTFGEEYTIDSPSSDGHTFTGWTDKDGNVVDSNYTHLIDNDLYISANWDIINYAIKYNLNGGTNSSKNPNSYTYNDRIVFDEATKVGYTFKGWQDQNGNQYTPKAEIIWNFTENITLTPIFEINKYNVVVDIDDLEAVVVKGDGVYEYNQDITLSVTINDGYIFLGWYDENDEFISRDKTLSISKIDKEYKYYVKTYKLDENGCYIYDGVKYKINDNDISVVGYVEGITTANISEEFINKKVTSIESNAFYGCSTLTSITIPSSVTEIGDNVFFWCNSLINVYYEGVIEGWCQIAFNDVFSNPMYIASHFYRLDKNNDYKELTEIAIPNTITNIGDYQFYGFNNVTSITISNSVTSIGSSAFYCCSSLTIYCEVSSKPNGWNDYWNYSDRPVYWGVEGE